MTASPLHANARPKTMASARNVVNRLRLESGFIEMYDS